MKNIDLKKELKHLYNPSKKEVNIVEVSKMAYLSIDGRGNPNTVPRYKEAVEALYSVSYALKFMVKKGTLSINYSVMPLEGLWWTETSTEPSMENKDEWLWTAMIMQPEWITKELVAEAIEQVRKKKKLPILTELRFTSLEEGKSAQIMYVGPYQNETATIKKIHEYIEQAGGKLTGKHHEIYLNDPRRTAPDKLKTIIRQPFN